MNNSQEIVVLGGGESGVGAAILAKEQGQPVFLSDSGAIPPARKAELQAEQNQIPFEENGHTTERILRARAVVKSPGIPTSAPLVQQLMQQGTPVLSEIEYAYPYIPADTTLIGITGSNGKTTTTCWLHYLLTLGGADAALAGNVGFSLARQVARDPHQCYVIELSSFQLDHMYRFRNHVSILMNITPDHLDRYNHSFTEYALAKMRILQNMTQDDYFVYRQEDPFITRYLAEHPVPCRLLPFTTQADPTASAYATDTELVATVEGRTYTIALDRIILPGKHNLQNAMAVVLSALALNQSPTVITQALTTYRNQPHRLEPVGNLDGVAYINDSKATNISSTQYALEAVTTPVVLILGGTDKGNDYNDLMPFVQNKVVGMVFLTPHDEKLQAAFGNLFPHVTALSMEEAITQARRMAPEGSTVLLSPACASFDLFKNYEDRGDQFRSVVQGLIRTEGKE